MAPFGEPKYVDKVWKLIKQDSDGSFSLNMEYFTFHQSTENTYGSKFVELFGPERDPKLYFFTPESGFLLTLVINRQTMPALRSRTSTMRTSRQASNELRKKF